ncbi:DUF4876 domain-containing protein [Hoylesella loescheii]|uniref:DUF4876 domain-containing protein n=1 Tax=Hoylesella loescheii TaxID=840 RepID=UPI0026F1AAE5|nr:DUF4876 domain-containing protein [Hoylesella loescheii]
MKESRRWGNRIALLLTMAMAVFFTACSEDETPEVSSASVKVNVKIDKAFEKAKAQKVAITLRNTSTGKETAYETTLNGTVQLPNLPVDMYDITASYTLPASEYSEITGEKSTEDVLFSAAATGVQLQPNKETTINLELTTSTTDDFVLKTIYYAGSDSKKAGGEDDRFIEIYNNSSRTLYADSLCLALTTMNRYGFLANGKPHSYMNKNFYFTANGTYDWSKSEGMADAEGANSKYVYGDVVIMVPGSGKDYPIKPGESFIIAPFAQNYKQPFTTSSGKQVSPEWPDSTLDLSKAEFDVVYPGYEELDNKSAVNMVIIKKGSNLYMRPSRNGKEGYVIFRHPSPSKLPEYRRPYIDMKKADHHTYMQIPNTSIIDAVEVINPNADGYVSPKAFPKSLDASYAFSKPDYSFRCISRKVSRVNEGRRILQDLNNSALDFVQMIPDPKAFAPSK